MPDRKASARALVEALHAAENAADERLPTLLIGVPGGVETAVENVAWNTSTTCESAVALARLPEGACSEMILHCFTASEVWLKRFLDLGQHLTELLVRKSPAEQQALVEAWIVLGRRVAEAGTESAEGEADWARAGMLRSLQQGVSDYLTRQRVLDPARHSSLTTSVGQLLSAIDALERGPMAWAISRPLGGDGSWSQRLLVPTGFELDPLLEPTLQPNRVHAGQHYAAADEYLQVHFELLREDFVRPLREAVGKVHALQQLAERDGLGPWQEQLGQLPREVKVWPYARLCGATVGEPGGILHKLQLASSPEEASLLDLSGSGGLMNGSLLLVSTDGFATMRSAIVARREAARALGEGCVYVCFGEEGSETLKDPRTVQSAARRAEEIASQPQTEVSVLEASAYWGAYWPVLQALQAQAKRSLPLSSILLRCDSEAATQAPLYLKRAASRARAARAAEKAAGLPRGCGYDLRPVLNETEQGEPFYMGDVCDSWPKHGTSLDAWQRQAAKALLTRQLGLVQGPPGTGKTFVGLCAPPALEPAQTCSNLLKPAQTCSNLLEPSPTACPLAGEHARERARERANEHAG